MFNTVSTATNLFLANLSNLEQRLTTSQLQLTSGLRINNVSDAPDQVGQMLQLKADISRNNQIKTNLTTIQAEVNSAESAINTAGMLMDKAVQLASQGNNTTTTVDQRKLLATQVEAIMTQMVNLANTKFENRYIFSGNNDQVLPYAGLDLTQPNGVGTYQGSPNNKQVEGSNGSNLTVSLTAAQIFDGGGASTSVFQVLTSLYNDLMTNNTANLSTDSANLSTASAYLSAQQAQYGNFQNQITDALTYQGQLDTQFKAQLSAVQDADPIAAATALTQGETSLQAALQAEAAMPKKSLFDYIG
jgi:flagellar hook-associated protein 3 FlgL